MPADYWNQFLHVQEENIRSPPFNPNTHNADGTPKTPQGVTGKRRLDYSYTTPQVRCAGGCVKYVTTPLR